MVFALQLLNGKTDKLELIPSECLPTKRNVDDVPSSGVVTIEDVVQMGELVASMAQNVEAERNQMEVDGRHSPLCWS